MSYHYEAEEHWFGSFSVLTTPFMISNWNPLIPSLTRYAVLAPGDCSSASIHTYDDRDLAQLLQLALPRRAHEVLVLRGEFHNIVIPGQLGKDYTWPSPSSVDYFMSAGFNTFRIPFLMERMSAATTGGLGGSFNQTYLSGLKTIVNYITGKGGYAVVDPHNFMIYHGATISSTSDFQSWWQKLATEFKSDSHVIFSFDSYTEGMLTQMGWAGIVLPEHRAPERGGHRANPPASARAVPVKLVV